MIERCTSGRQIPELELYLHQPCGRALTRISYRDQDGNARSCLVCPKCDGPVADMAAKR